ncbi:hypothetical protein, partial [Komagataeibacter swingsii]|uniref:hypothetical protein n=1 Tax=Komagataeibacter swingsii TaxID=215220 RepID=UPI00222EB996
HCMEADDQWRDIPQAGGSRCNDSGHRFLTKLANTTHGKKNVIVWADTAVLQRGDGGSFDLNGRHSARARGFQKPQN